MQKEMWNKSHGKQGTEQTVFPRDPLMICHVYLLHAPVSADLFPPLPTSLLKSIVYKTHAAANSNQIR